MSIQDEMEKAAKDASALREALVAYPDVVRVGSSLHATVPMDKVNVVCAEREGGAETSIRFGDASGKLTVWSKETFSAVDLLETLLDVPGGREALAKATEPNK